MYLNYLLKEIKSKITSKLGVLRHVKKSINFLYLSSEIAFKQIYNKKHSKLGVFKSVKTHILFILGLSPT